MYKFWFDYVKRKCNEKAKLYYMDTDTDCTCKKIFMKINMKMLQKIANNFNYELEKPLPQGENEKLSA